ncbi:hypothetical protein GCM10009838_81310 [Catenulispora subtropica]|uniref:Uncharacterized protein n=1 Tax=Catenulispora subtropica TaxID=450798 RepID=A0ABN2TA17_9ACTN
MTTYARLGGGAQWNSSAEQPAPPPSEENRMSANEELEVLVEAMLAAEPEGGEDEENTGDLLWKISYSTFRD